MAGANTGTTSGNADQQHLLARITDPRGQVVMANQFDAQGRLTGTADAQGQAAQQSFDLATNTQTVTDRRGNRTVYTFDADGNITRSVNALGQTTTYTYDANGNETSVTNALGHKTERTFDPATGKQISETNPLGHTTTTQYLGLGAPWQRTNPLSTTDARGNTTQYKYEDGEFDTGKNKEPGAVPVRLNEPLGRSTAIGLDVKGNLLELDIAGERLSYAYDAQGRRIRETNGLGHQTTYTYDANGNETSRSASRSTASGTRTETVTRLYDAENRLIEETDALGAKRRSTYNAAGKLETQTDSQGRVTRYTYDANARLVKTEYPEGSGVATETIEYDAEGNETARTDRAGRITRMSYDALNRLAATTHPDGSTETTEYDAAGRVAATVDRLGRRTTFEYDEAGRQTASTDASGVRTTQAYDANGNRTRLTVDGRTTAYEYDALNRLTRTTWPDGSTHTTAWRPDNRKQSETDARGLTTTYGWDAAGRLASVTQSGVAGTTTYAYDQTGAKTTQLDALGRATTWAHDAAGRVLSRTIQDGSTERHSYDSEGNRLAHKTFAGEDIAYQYDSANRVSGEVIPRAASGAEGGATSYTYSATGNLLTQQESGANSLQGTQTHRYDANDRLVELNNPLGQLRYGWDAAGQITERSVQGSASAAAVPAGTVRYEHDAAGRLLKVTATDGKQARYRYDAAGRMITTERDLNPKDGQAQLLITHHRHDAADRLVAVAEVLRAGAAPQATDTLLAGQALSRGAGGAISRIETYRAGASYDSQAGIFSGTPASTQAFEYDGNARLTRETRTVGSGAAAAITDTRYEYDAAGNRTTKTVTTAAGTEITTYSYDAADRLTSESTSLPAGGSRVVTYTWDANGDLASKTEPGRVTLYRFDARNRLIDIRSGPTNAEASAASPSVSYGYDAQGNRIRKATSQGATSYLIDSTFQYAQLAREITAAAGQGAAGASTATDYVRGLQLVRQRRSDGEPSADLFPLHGHLGTSLGAVDANGAVVEVVDADAFGNLAQPTGLKQAHLYTGEYWDQDSQLVYLRARWYDARVGRFISADPFEGRQRDPRSQNRYSYVGGDPLHNTDPSGRETLQSQLQGLDAQARSIASQISHAISNNRGGVAGALRNQLGTVVEQGVKKVVEMCLKKGKGEITKVARRGTGDVDFIIRVKDQLFRVEVKYQFPKSGSSALERLVDQVNRHGGDVKERLAVFFGKEIGPRAFGNREHLLASLVKAGKEPHLMINGFVELAWWLGEAAGEACL